MVPDPYGFEVIVDLGSPFSLPAAPCEPNGHANQTTEPMAVRWGRTNYQHCSRPYIHAGVSYRGALASLCTASGEADRARRRWSSQTVLVRIKAFAAPPAPSSRRELAGDQNRTDVSSWSEADWAAKMGDVGFPAKIGRAQRIWWQPDLTTAAPFRTRSGRAWVEYL